MKSDENLLFHHFSSLFIVLIIFFYFSVFVNKGLEKKGKNRIVWKTRFSIFDFIAWNR